MNRRFQHSGYPLGGATCNLRPMAGRRWLRRCGAAADDPRVRRAKSAGYRPATRAERRAQLLRSLGGMVAALVGFYATLALLIALITIVGHY